MLLFGSGDAIHQDVSNCIMSSESVRSLFAECWTSWYHGEDVIPHDLIRFIVDGYLCMLIKDRYRLRLQNALGVKSGASILPTMQVVSGISQAKRDREMKGIKRRDVYVYYSKSSYKMTVVV